MPGATVGGHFGSVEDITWDPKGKFIVSVGSDQTSRIHAQWLRSNKTITNKYSYVSLNIQFFNFVLLELLLSINPCIVNYIINR